MNNRRMELTELAQAFRAAPTEAGPATAGRMLEAAGELLRRTGALEVDAAQVESVLRLLPRSLLEAWLRTVDVDAVGDRLRRAADEALEAALPESDGDGETWAEWALTALIQRDGLESQQVALSVVEPGLGRQLDERLAVVDRALRSKARWFVGLNERRRRERDQLDERFRARAWWYSDRGDCDGLIAALSGDKPSAHVKFCADCQRDLRLAAEVDAPRGRHLDSDDLWRYDFGLATPAERAVVEQHVVTCSECARALDLLREDDEAELPEPAPLPRQTRAVQEAPPPVQIPDAAVEHGGVRVLVFRQPERLRVVVQPTREHRLAAAAVHLPAAPRPFVARSAGGGFEVELPSSAVRTTARVRVQLAAGEDVDLEVSL